jgi:alkylation response protein AidB-like acyl-CoA dehydrogenase
MQRCFDKTLEYAKEREAFGRPIGKFQAIRHKFAEMATKIERPRAHLHDALALPQRRVPVREITMAKLYAQRDRLEVADECLQIHGGAGYMKEYEIERAWRDMRLEPDRRRHRRDHEGDPRARGARAHERRQLEPHDDRERRRHEL